MPVRRFRSIEAMSEPIWRTPGDPALYHAIAGVLDLARRTNPRTFVPGVRRFRDIEEMTRARDTALAEHIEAIQQRRGQSTEN